MLKGTELNTKLEKAKSGKLNFKCYTKYRYERNNGVDDCWFQIEDVNYKLYYAEILTNGGCYHETLRECIEDLFGTERPIMYHDVNLNPIKRDVLLNYNVYTGQCSPTYYYDWSELEKFEKGE